jgi:hypothetical protein
MKIRDWVKLGQGILLFLLCILGGMIVSFLAGPTGMD